MDLSEVMTLERVHSVPSGRDLFYAYMRDGSRQNLTPGEYGAALAQSFELARQLNFTVSSAAEQSIPRPPRDPALVRVDSVFDAASSATTYRGVYSDGSVLALSEADLDGINAAAASAAKAKLLSLGKSAGLTWAHLRDPK